MKSKCCKNPFVRFHIDLDGGCYFCCPAGMKTKIGNIFEQTFDEIWYGEKAIEFRKKILNNDYSECNLKFCKKIMNMMMNAIIH